MSEVEETEGFIDDGKAMGHEGIDTACDNAVYKELINHEKAKE